MDWKDYLAEANRNLARVREIQPQAAAGFGALARAATVEGALSVREKELMCIAIGIIRQCTDCIGFHVKAAIRAGATREMVAECIAVTMYMGGGPAYMYGAKALEAFDQLSAP